MPPAAAPVPTLVFENAAGQMLADPQGFVRMQWSAQVRALADTQAFLSHLSEQLRTRGWSRALIDQVGMRAFSPAEQTWITQQWLPQAVHEAGYRAGAIVLATDTFSRLATAFVTTNVQGLPLRYRSFDDEASAVAWLVRQG